MLNLRKLNTIYNLLHKYIFTDNLIISINVNNVDNFEIIIENRIST